METIEKIKKFFLLAQELQTEATEGEGENFFKLIKQAESEMDADEEFVLSDVVRFACDVQDAIEEGYESLVDYIDDNI
jgi:hypothetical protein